MAAKIDWVDKFLGVIQVGAYKGLYIKVSEDNSMQFVRVVLDVLITSVGWQQLIAEDMSYDLFDHSVWKRVDNQCKSHNNKTFVPAGIEYDKMIKACHMKSKLSMATQAETIITEVE